MYQQNNLTSNSVTIKGVLLRSYQPNEKVLIASIKTGILPSEVIQVILYPSVIDSLHTQKILIGNYVSIYANIQSSIRAGGKITQSIICNSITKSFYSPLSSEELFANRFEVYGEIVSTETILDSGNYESLYVLCKRDGRTSKIRLSLVPGTLEGNGIEVGQTHRFLGEVVLRKNFSKNGNCYYVTDFVVNTLA